MIEYLYNIYYFNLFSGIQDLFTNFGRNLIEMIESSTPPVNLKLEIDPEEISNNDRINNSKVQCCTN